MSSIALKFLNSVSEVLDLINFNGLKCTPTIFLFNSVIAISITSFTSDFLVIATSYGASLVLIVLNKDIRKNLKIFVTTAIYVGVFSLIALSPLLINNRVNYYVIYVIRALAAASLLLASIKTLGWMGLAEAFYGLRIPALGKFIVMYVRMLSTLIKDTSRSILCREARMLRNASFGDMFKYTALVGDLFMKGCIRGWRTSLAINARTIEKNSNNVSSKLKLTGLDLFMTSIAFTEVVLQLV